MIISKKNFFAPVWLICLALCCNGCVALAGAAAGAGGVVWVKGRLQEELNYSLDEVYQATKNAIDQMNLPLSIDRKDAMTAKIESKFSDGTNVWIDLKYLAAKSTEIKLRVGVMGDLTRSNKILDQVKKNL